MSPAEEAVFTNNFAAAMRRSEDARALEKLWADYAVEIAGCSAEGLSRNSPLNRLQKSGIWWNPDFPYNGLPAAMGCRKALSRRLRMAEARMPPSPDPTPLLEERMRKLIPIKEALEELAFQTMAARKKALLDAAAMAEEERDLAFAEGCEPCTVVIDRLTARLRAEAEE